MWVYFAFPAFLAWVFFQHLQLLWLFTLIPRLQGCLRFMSWIGFREVPCRPVGPEYPRVQLSICSIPVRLVLPFFVFALLSPSFHLLIFFLRRASHHKWLSCLMLAVGFSHRSSAFFQGGNDHTVKDRRDSACALFGL